MHFKALYYLCVYSWRAEFNDLDGHPGSERAGLPEAEGVEEAGEGDGERAEGVGVHVL